MPRIFEDINIDELEEYRNYDDLAAFFENNDEVLDVNNNVTRGFLLSYGQNAGVIPVGTFILVGYEDSEGLKTDELDAILKEGYVVFKQIEKKDNLIVIPKDAKRITIPYKTYALAFKTASHNNKEFGYLSGDQSITPAVVEDVREFYSDSLAAKRPDADMKTLDLYGSRLADAHVEYTTADGKELGSNYTIYPFELVLGMYMDSDLINYKGLDEDSYGSIIR